MANWREIGIGAGGVALLGLAWSHFHKPARPSSVAAPVPLQQPQSSGAAWQGLAVAGGQALIQTGMGLAQHYLGSTGSVPGAPALSSVPPAETLGDLNNATDFTSDATDFSSSASDFLSVD